MKKIFLAVMIFSNLILFNCESGESNSPGTDAATVKMSRAVATRTSINLEWTAPSDTDVHAYNITWSDGVNSQSAQVNGTELTYSITELTQLTKYDVSVTAEDQSGNESPQVSFYLYTTVTLLNPRTHYFIYTADDLDAVRGEVSGYDDWSLDSSYILMNNIQLSGTWVPLGNDTTGFSGLFFGNGHEISGLLVNGDSQPYQGLFGFIEAAGAVYDLGVSGTVAGNQYTGGLAGYTAGRISNCHSKVTVTGAAKTGGLIGANDGGVITRCYSTGDVKAYYNYDYRNQAGGLLGENTGGGEIRECYSTADVNGYAEVGGLAGSQSSGIIINCYARGIINSHAESLDYNQAGGLLGLNEGTGAVAYCYSSGKVYTGYICGGLIGYNTSTGDITASFYDTTTSGMDDEGKGTPVITALMKSSGTFTAAGWDFTIEKIWYINSSINAGYPYLVNNPPAN